MPRFFLAPESWQPLTRLDEEESRHASQVLRLRVGDVLEVFDGQGRRAEGEIATITKHQVSLRLKQETFSVATSPAITLVQAVPKGKTFEWIVEKAVELGVTEVIPLVTRHTVVQYDAEDGLKKMAKWQRVAMEACKQCGQDHLPRIHAPITWSAWLPRPHQGLRIIASLADGAVSLRSLLEAEGAFHHATILIGPEGDFSAQETAQALAAGFHPVTLGQIILRAETAAIFALSALRFSQMDK
jgi:16S rRNA (uracil1498-N3)-methyltransferase